MRNFYASRSILIILLGTMFSTLAHAQSWQGEQKTLPTPYPIDISGYASTYGSSVAIDGNYAVVGAVGDDEKGTDAGAAFVYYYDGTTWQLIKKLTAADAAAADNFGSSVAIFDSTIIIGAPSDDVGIRANQGSVYLFYKNKGGTNNWGQVKKIIAPDGVADDYFGHSIAISGTTITVGHYRDDTPLGVWAGSVYIFSKDLGGIDNWGLVKNITASNGYIGDQFGYSVDISDSIIVVGAPSKDTNSITDSGMAYVFHENSGGPDNWGEVKILTATDIKIYNSFGHSVAVSDSTIVVGAYFDITNYIGNAYVFGKNTGGSNQWGSIKKLAASDIDIISGDYFGYSVAISSNYILVGSYRSLSTQGAAYLFAKDEGGADNWGEIKKLTASDGISNDRLGISVAIDSAYVLTGAFFHDAAGTDNGAAYFFNQDAGGTNNWGQTQKTLPVGALIYSTASQYGMSIDMAGSYAVVGAFLDDEKGVDAGAAFIMHFNGTSWETIKRLTAFDGITGDWYGIHVAISGTTIAIGASHADPYGNDSGAAYVYEKDQGGTDNWGLVKKVIQSDGAIGDSFGRSLDINGDMMVVGAHGDDDKGAQSGSAYVFLRNQGGADNWGQIKKIVPADGATGDHFGADESVSISGTTVAIGSRYDDDKGVDSGSVYIFDQNQGGVNNWGLVKKLVANDGVANASYGHNNLLMDSTMIVGAPLDDDNGLNSGSAYIYEQNVGGTNNWGLVKKISAFDGQATDIFGVKSALVGNMLVIGAYGDDDGGTDAGAVYVYGKNNGGLGSWGFLEKITASDAMANDWFGNSVAAAGNKLLVGSLTNDEAGTNDGAAYFYDFYNTPPAVTITSTAGSTTATSPIPITITFSKPVQGFTLSDLQVTNGSASNLQTSDYVTYTADITPIVEGAITIDIAAGVANDAYNYPNLTATQLQVTYDATGPIVIASPSNGKVYTNVSQFEMTLTFTEEVAGMALNQLTVTNGTVANLQTLDNITFTVDITATAEGAVTTEVKTGVVKDLAGNDIFLSFPFPVVYDITPPTVTISTTASSPTASTTLPVAIVFNEKSLLALNGISVGNGSATNLVTTDSLTYNVDITATANGTVTVDVLVGAATDLAGNGNTAASQLAVVVDTSSPAVTISSTVTSPTNNTPFTADIVFSEAVTGFDLTDITVGNGTASNLQTTDSISFTADITPTNDGSVTIDVAAAVVQDLAGNDNTAASQFSMVYDGTAPTVVMSSNEPDPTPNTPFVVTFTWSEEVVSFLAAALTVGNATATNLQTSDNITYTVDITPTADGLVTVDLAAGLVLDGAGNGNLEATQLSRTFDASSPTGAITSAEADLTNNTPFSITITWSEEVVGFELVDIAVGNGTAANLQTADNIVFTADITPDLDAVVTVNVSAASVKDKVGYENAQLPQFSITFDGTPPGVSINTNEPDPTTSSPFAISLLWSEKVVGFSESDIVVTNGTVSNLQTTDDQQYTADITPVDVGEITLNIDAGVVTDVIGNNNTVANAFTITYAKILGLEDLEKIDPLSVYPNPVVNQLIIEPSEDLNGEFWLRLIDAAGKEWQHRKIQIIAQEPILLDVASYPAGTYIVVLQKENHAYMMKIVKE